MLHAMSELRGLWFSKRRLRLRAGEAVLASFEES